MVDEDFRFERYEEYFGEKEEVIKKIDNCSICGAKLVFSHFPDYKHLIIQETARCVDCGSNARKVMHFLN